MDSLNIKGKEAAVYKFCLFTTENKCLPFLEDRLLILFLFPLVATLQSGPNKDTWGSVGHTETACRNSHTACAKGRVQQDKEDIFGDPIVSLLERRAINELNTYMNT